MLKDFNNIDPNSVPPTKITKNLHKIGYVLVCLAVFSVSSPGFRTLFFGLRTLFSGFRTLFSGFRTLFSGFRTLFPGFQTLFPGVAVWFSGVAVLLSGYPAHRHTILNYFRYLPYANSF